MVLLNMYSLDLKNGAEHLATDWEVSDSLSFENILLSKKEDYINKKKILFSNNLDPTLKYYARARPLLSTGYAEWGNIDVFTVVSDNDIRPQEIFPTRVSIPILSTYRINTGSTIDAVPETGSGGWKGTIPEDGSLAGSSEFDTSYNVIDVIEPIDPDIHDIALFEIWAEGFEVIGNAKHLATTWWIEDTNRNVIWASPFDYFNLNKIKVSSVILKKDSIYRIKALFHTTSNDTSQVATYTITTINKEGITLTTYLDLVDPSLEKKLTIEHVEGLNTVNWEILSYDGGILTSVWYRATSGVAATIDRNTLKENMNYILRVRTNLVKSWNYYPFITSLSSDASPEDVIVPGAVFPTDFTMYVDDVAKVYIQSQATEITANIKDDSICRWDSIGKTIVGLKEGSTIIFLYLRAQGYAERLVRLYVNVVARSGVGQDGTVVKVEPSSKVMVRNTDYLFTVTTGCRNWTVDIDPAYASWVKESVNTFRVKAESVGNLAAMVLAYDTQNDILGSAPLSLNIIKSGLDQDEEETGSSEWWIKCDKETVKLKPGSTETLMIETTCLSWKIANIDGTCCTASKLSHTSLLVTPVSRGTANIRLEGDDGTNKVAVLNINVVVEQRATPTDLTFTSTGLTGKVNQDLTILYTTNCTSMSEITLSESGGYDLVSHSLGKIIIKPHYNKQGNNIILYMSGKKTDTDTDKYTESTANLLIPVDVITTEQDLVIKPSLDRDDVEEDLVDSTRNVYVFKTNQGVYDETGIKLHNPISVLHTYVNENITDLRDITIKASDPKVTIKNIVLGDIMTGDPDYNGFRKLTYDIYTADENLNTSESYTLAGIEYNVYVTYDRNVYLAKFKLDPYKPTELKVVPEDFVFKAVGDTKELTIEFSGNDEDLVVTSHDLSAVEVIMEETRETVTNNDSDMTVDPDNTPTPVTRIKRKYTLKCLSMLDTSSVTVRGADKSGYNITRTINVRVNPTYEDFGITQFTKYLDRLSWSKVLENNTFSGYFSDEDPSGIFPPLDAMNWSTEEWDEWGTEQVTKFTGDDTKELFETIASKPINFTVIKYNPLIIEDGSGIQSIVVDNPDRAKKWNQIFPFNVSTWTRDDWLQIKDWYNDLQPVLMNTTFLNRGNKILLPPATAVKWNDTVWNSYATVMHNYVTNNPTVLEEVVGIDRINPDSVGYGMSLTNLPSSLDDVLTNTGDTLFIEYGQRNKVNTPMKYLHKFTITTDAVNKAVGLSHFYISAFDGSKYLPVAYKELSIVEEPKGYKHLWLYLLTTTPGVELTNHDITGPINQVVYDLTTQDGTVEFTEADIEGLKDNRYTLMPNEILLVLEVKGCYTNGTGTYTVKDFVHRDVSNTIHMSSKENEQLIITGAFRTSKQVSSFNYKPGVSNCFSIGEEVTTAVTLIARDGTKTECPTYTRTYERTEYSNDNISVSFDYSTRSINLPNEDTSIPDENPEEDNP